MCNIEKKYDEFANMLNSGKLPAGKDFRENCKRLRVSAASLDEIIMEELGKSGQEIMDEYFGNEGVF